jgi:hypothetical protein
LASIMLPFSVTLAAVFPSLLLSSILMSSSAALMMASDTNASTIAKSGRHNPSSSRNSEWICRRFQSPPSLTLWRRRLPYIVLVGRRCCRRLPLYCTGFSTGCINWLVPSTAPIHRPSRSSVLSSTPTVLHWLFHRLYQSACAVDGSHTSS